MGKDGIARRSEYALYDKQRRDSRTPQLPVSRLRINANVLNALKRFQLVFDDDGTTWAVDSLDLKRHAPVRGRSIGRGIWVG